MILNKIDRAVNQYGDYALYVLAFSLLDYAGLIRSTPLMVPDVIGVSVIVGMGLLSRFVFRRP